MARTTGIFLLSVQRIWQPHRLQPHRIRTFKRSHDHRMCASLKSGTLQFCCPRLTMWECHKMSTAEFHAIRKWATETDCPWRAC
jgi:hypothetical protein